MSLVHEKLYRSDLNNIDFGEYVNELAHMLLRNYKIKPDAISLELDTESVLLPIDLAVPCGLMLNELITNILKYAFGEGKDGEIFISLHIIDKKTIELRVQDNGMGIPDDFDIDKTETLDFKIVKIIGNKQLRGTVECRKLQPGTEVIIRFRNPKNE